MITNAVETYYDSPSIYNSTSNPLQGNVHFVNNRLSVYDGYHWIELPQLISRVDLSYQAKMALDWVEQKMAEESNLASLAASNPAVFNALASVNRAKEQLAVIVALSEGTNEITS